MSASGYDSTSTGEVARELSQHAQSSSRHVEAGVRSASSTSIGEVESRTHTERIEFEPKLLELQIELLEKSQEYPCCPAGEVKEMGGGG